MIPGGIQALETANGGKSIDEISGFANIKNQIASVRADTLGKLET